MDNQRIVYRNDAGGISIIIPAPEAVAIHGIEAIAQKDVPEGEPYKIVETSDIPTDRSTRDAWDIDDAILTDGVGAPWDTFDEVENV